MSKAMHSVIKDISLNGIIIKILPALKDNYMYLISCPKTNEAAVIDPAEPQLVKDAVKENNLTLTKVLTTHHHYDHAGGNEDIMRMFDNKLKIYGGDERILGLTNKVKDQEQFNIGTLCVTCIFTPCHTTGHICYYIRSSADEKCVFTGDTLFQGGCGRFFEGTAHEMYSSLCTKLASLPDNTLVFCGHEYTLQNMNFAQHVEPNNKYIKERIAWAKMNRQSRYPTVPSTMGEEKLWNPFMRVNEIDVKNHAGKSDPISVMQAIRDEKDRFVS